MPVGPGKYDDTCTEVRLKHDAAFVLVAIIGNRGEGFSVQIDAARIKARDSDKRVVAMLRDIADQIAESLVEN
jgi:hypothetical protein